MQPPLLDPDHLHANQFKKNRQKTGLDNLASILLFEKYRLGLGYSQVYMKTLKRFLIQVDVRELTVSHIDTITSSLGSQLRLQLATQVNTKHNIS